MGIDKQENERIAAQVRERARVDPEYAKQLAAEKRKMLDSIARGPRLAYFDGKPYWSYS